MPSAGSTALPPMVLSAELAAIIENLNDPLADPSTARSLPIECYTSPEWFEFERRAIWDREWICLGHWASIPNAGDYFSIEVNDDHFLVVRGRDNNIRVMPAVCQHRGHLLGDAHGTAEHFACPYHGWVYGLDGTLLSAAGMEPYATVAELKQSHCLPVLRSEIWNGFIFVNLDGQATPLAPRLKALTQDVANYRLAELKATPVEEFAGNPWNWKWMQENGLEPYHTPVAHKGSHDHAPAHQSTFPEWDEGDDGAVYYSTRFIHRDGNFNPTLKCLFPPIETLSEEDRWRVLFGVVPPNLLIATLPDSAFYFIIRPQGANALTLRVGFLFPESTMALPDFDQTLELSIEGFNTVNAEDIAANISVHQGRRSRFANRGRVGPLEQPMVQLNHWFVTRYRSYLKFLEAG